MNQKVFLIVFSLLLLIWVFHMIHYLSVNNYISWVVESFTSGTSHSVDLPLTTTYTCNNFCSPTARCAMTGQQCLADADCPGCQKGSPNARASSAPVPGANDGGKMTVGVTPQYSTLTSGYGTHQRIISNDPPAQANFGPKVWLPGYQEEKAMFDKRYQPGPIQFMPSYPSRDTATGEFVDDGPLAANY